MKQLVSLTRSLLLAAMVLVPTLAAQQLIETQSGNTLEGTLLSDDGKAISFRTVDGMTMTLSYADLGPKTIYRLMAARTARTDGPGQLALGNQAASADLFDAARDAYAFAVQADPSLRAEVDAKMASLRVAASNSLLAEAQKEAGLNHADAAMHSLATLMHEFPDEPAAKAGSAMLDTLHAGQTAARSKARAQTLSKEIQEALAPAEANYGEMGKKIKEGLQNTRNQTVALQDFNACIDLGKSARQALKGLQSQASTIPGLAPAIEQLDGEVVSQMIDGYTQVANVYNQRSSYNDANNAVNAGLALEPQNQQLLQLRSQIASNSAQGTGFVGWGAAGRLR